MASGENNSLFTAFISLLVLLVVTIAVNFAPLGASHLWVGLSIAVTKTIVVVIVFMGLGKSVGAVRLAAGVGLLWLSFAVTITMADYLTRGWDESQGGKLRKSDHYTTYDRVQYPDKDATPTSPATP